MKIDIGCGTPEQKKKGYIGIDVNTKYKPDLLHDCTYGIPYENKTITAIWMDNSLEHFPNPGYIINECNRVLKKGGTLEIKLPNTQYWPILGAMWFGDILKLWNIWMNSKIKTGRTQHYTLWTKETLKLQLQEHGFEIDEIKGFYLGKEFYCKATKIEDTKISYL